MSKHSAKRTEFGWSYRGYSIEQTDNREFEDGDLAWNIENSRGEGCDRLPTLWQCKKMIDGWVV